MSTNKTTNFGLSQWQSTDPIRVADFNADNQKLDTALAARAQLATGSYTGTGKFGSANPNTLTFPFEPKFVFVTRGMGTFLLAVRGCEKWKTSPLDNGSYSLVEIQWSGKKISWYSDRQADYQLNSEKSQYYYVAFA